jgi:hypothetical protein
LAFAGGFEITMKLLVQQEAGDARVVALCGGLRRGFYVESPLAIADTVVPFALVAT